jgi:hypothetical protein
VAVHFYESPFFSCTRTNYRVIIVQIPDSVKAIEILRFAQDDIVPTLFVIIWQHFQKPVSTTAPGHLECAEVAAPRGIEKDVRGACGQSVDQ